MSKYGPGMGDNHIAHGTQFFSSPYSSSYRKNTINSNSNISTIWSSVDSAPALYSWLIALFHIDLFQRIVTYFS